MTEVSDTKARQSFKVVQARPDLKWPGYRIECGFDANCKLGLWDARSNALNKGFAHVHLAHGVTSPRGERAAASRMFQEPK